MGMEMMISMMAMLCVNVSVFMTTIDAAASLQIHQMQASHDQLGYHHHDQQYFSPGDMITRKLMLQKRVEGYGDQDLVFYSQQNKAVSDEVQKRGEEAMVNGAKGSDPTHFTIMDYSHVRRRPPIHNNYFQKPTNSP